MSDRPTAETGRTGLTRTVLIVGVIGTAIVAVLEIATARGPRGISDWLLVVVLCAAIPGGSRSERSS